MRNYTRPIEQDLLIKALAEIAVLKTLRKDFGGSASFSGYGQVPSNWSSNLSQALSPSLPSGDFGNNEWASSQQHEQGIAQAYISSQTPAPEWMAGNQAAYADTIRQGQYAMDEQKMSPTSFADRLNTTLKRNKATDSTETAGVNAPAGFGGSGASGTVPGTFGEATSGGTSNYAASGVPVSSQPASSFPGGAAHGGGAPIAPPAAAGGNPSIQPATNLGPAAPQASTQTSVPAAGPPPSSTTLPKTPVS